MAEHFGSPLTNAIARQYDLFQQSLEAIAKDRKFLNYGYTVARGEPFEMRQQRLCLEVFEAADIQRDHVVVDVGFGSGEQDFVLARTFEFARLLGFNISDRQVGYATARAAREGLAHKLTFSLGEAEALPGVAAASVDRIVAVECAFYFDRPSFYRRAAEVLKPGGLLTLADIQLSDRLACLTRREDLRRVGTASANRREWERFFRARAIRHINRQTRPGVQLSVWQILKTVPFARFNRAQRREWLKLAYYSQLLALGLSLELVTYDLLVLEKAVAPSTSFAPRA
ncbi:MAG: SAM-dependent methyltransferase [Betaproteobacteria bacterium]